MVLFEQSIGDKELEPSSHMWVFKGVTAPTQDFSLIRTCQNWRCTCRRVRCTEEPGQNGNVCNSLYIGSLCMQDQPLIFSTLGFPARLLTTFFLPARAKFNASLIKNLITNRQNSTINHQSLVINQLIKQVNALTLVSSGTTF